jgi:molecular chaperone DnaK
MERHSPSGNKLTGGRAMARNTVDFGIDLGTTNSSIAVIRGVMPHVFSNDHEMKSTPSVVHLDKKDRLVVGQLAKNQLEFDNDNTRAEFKLQMGTATEYPFARSGRKMKPEELSAEVLKSLKGDVMQRSGEDIQAAVITVPAAFELPQSDATRRAAQLAGLTFSPLLQEPVAAALAYGFQSESDKVFWLVYDFGGGTFDAAVMQVRDGVIQVVNHGGDNMLGGKLLDWEIVDQLLIPALVRERPLSGFGRGNAKWSDAIAKLKHHAEEAKIRVSRQDSWDIEIDPLCVDDKGEPICFEFELKRADVERIAGPFITRSINICKKVLAEKRLRPGDIEKLLIVGGPPLAPYFRERLADPNEGLGIPLEFSVDPLTVVAQGAAIFAATQRIEGVVAPPVKSGEYAVELDYKPVGIDPEPLVGGKVVGRPGESLRGFTIEFANSDMRPAWRSGKIALSSDGAFMTTLVAEKGHPNTFMIELRDAKGTQQPASPDRFTYTIGLSITDPPLPHSVGVALANDEMLLFFEKGAPLPARCRKIRRVAYGARAGRAEDVIRIPLIEGENRRSMRNRRIGHLEIPGTKIKRDVPAGSEIEVTLDMNPSRILLVRAYIPILDEEYETVFNYADYRQGAAHPESLRAEIDREKKRLEEVRKKVAQMGDDKARNALQRIDGERIEHDVESALAASRVDPDAAQKCEQRLMDLRVAIDEVEDAIEWPALVAEAQEEIRLCKEVVGQYGNAADKRNAEALEGETRRAMEGDDADHLKRKRDEMAGLRVRVLCEQPGFWVGYLQYLEGQKQTMRDAAKAEQLIAQAHRAMNAPDVPALKAAVRQLIELLPADQQREMMKGFGSGVM